MYQCDKCFHQYCVSNDSLASCNVCENGDMFSPIKESEDNKMDFTCPNCNREIMFDDEFTNFYDAGDYIIATATYICPECGDAMTVRATFVWDGELEVD